MSNYTYSIITPHFKSCDLLKRMITSVPDREDIQLIVVDDNSFNDKDKIKEILGLELLSRIELYYNPSSVHGAGRCRNEGLEHAKGKWVLFIDADDYLTKDAFSIIDRFACRSEDIIYFSPDSLKEPENTGGNRHKTYKKLINEYLNGKQSEEVLKYRLHGPWSKLIRRELIEKYHIRFDTCCWSEDVMFSVRTAYYAKKIDACADTIYIITERENSLTSNVSPYKYQVEVWVYVRKYLFLKKRINEDVFKRVTEWPGGKLIRAITGGYGYRMVKFIRELYRKNNISVSISDIKKEYVLESLDFLRQKKP